MLLQSATVAIRLCEGLGSAKEEAVTWQIFSSFAEGSPCPCSAKLLAAGPSFGKRRRHSTAEIQAAQPREPNPK